MLKKAAIGGLSATIFALEVVNDLTPGVRMAGRRRLPNSMSAGLVGAEIATWGAVSPSLLPRPWWVTAANVALVQATAHLVATSIARAVPARWHPSQRKARAVHWALGAITCTVGAVSLHNQAHQASLVGTLNERGPAKAAAGMAAGTVGYGFFLVAGRALRLTANGLSHQAQRWLPPVVADPGAYVLLSGVAAILSNRLLWRHFLREITTRSRHVNQLVFPDSYLPWEPERSGSPWSFEPWTAVGAQGRRFLTRGPRAHDIRQVMKAENTFEPIRIFIGLVPGRGVKAAARHAMAELERTGAFHRDHLIITMPAGSGWINNYSASAYEFLTLGNCATVAVQYSFLPSVFSFPLDRVTPVRIAGELIALLRDRLEDMEEGNRPKVYLSGESFGAFALLENFETAEEMLQACDGAVFTAPPRMTPFTLRLLSRRDKGSLERLPVFDGGRHIRFVGVPEHLHTDAFKRRYPHTWQHPRIVIAQHASDAIVWWDFTLAYRRPDWLAEPTPRSLYADTLPHLVWLPLITFWQVMLDQLNALNVPGGHGHNYFAEVFWYWDAVLGAQSASRLGLEVAQRMEEFIRRTQPRG